MIEENDVKPIENFPCGHNLRLRWHNNARRTFFVLESSFWLTFCTRTAKKVAEEAIAIKTSSGSASKIIVPGTPRSSSLGSAGSRLPQTPRKRVGL